MILRDDCKITSSAELKSVVEVISVIIIKKAVEIKKHFLNIELPSQLSHLDI